MRDGAAQRHKLQQFNFTSRLRLKSYFLQNNATMNLVNYSDSDDSGDEAPAPAKVQPKPTLASSKPAIPKLIDRSNPSKIKVNLPTASTSAGNDDIEKDAPPAKKQKTSGGGFFGGLGGTLPAPKNTGKRPLGRGLGSGISLKTGAEKTFSREPVQVEPVEPVNLTSANGTSDEHAEGTGKLQEKPFTPIGDVTRFKPLSVIRRQQAKKKKATVSGANTNASTASAAAAPSSTVDASKPKVSLFSMSQQEMPSTRSTTSEYKPLLLGSEKPSTQDDSTMLDSSSADPASAPAAPDPNSLSSLNLSAAERRQLFGRSGNAPENIQIQNFNVDAQYQSNQEYIRSGETIQHNPVHAIQPGKHSLRQLVNAANVQKDALEESFANKAKRGGMGRGGGNW